jgi:hypothetical protein
VRYLARQLRTTGHPDHCQGVPAPRSVIVAEAMYHARRVIHRAGKAPLRALREGPDFSPQPVKSKNRTYVGGKPVVLMTPPALASTQTEFG